VIRYIDRCALSVCCDISARSLHILQGKLRRSGRTALLVRADVCALPFRSHVFDDVICANALQHLPGDSNRRCGIKQLVRVMKEQGRLVLSTHNFSQGKRRAGWTKEKHHAGSHSGAVQYIYRYEADELREVMEDYVAVDRLLGAGLPFKYRYGLAPVFRRVERMLRRTSYGIERGHMLVAACRKHPPQPAPPRG
jgi:ubiquinone/menaquinone biosynthesis C-methylase UbiE